MASLVVGCSVHMPVHTSKHCSMAEGKMGAGEDISCISKGRVKAILAHLSHTEGHSNPTRVELIPSEGLA